MTSIEWGGRLLYKIPSMLLHAEDRIALEEKYRNHREQNLATLGEREIGGTTFRGIDRNLHLDFKMRISEIAYRILELAESGPTWMSPTLPRDSGLFVICSCACIYITNLVSS